ncbi:DUF1801 domain-containing protein [bacterium]|nr:DUF1801 domain-containing protein [bacterium]
MAELKTKKNSKNVTQFLNTIENEQKRKDCLDLMKLMAEATGSKPVMWGDAIVGFGDYHYRSESGREGDWFVAGFSPRKQNISLYLLGGIKKHPDLLGQLGKHKTGGSCLYINHLSDINLKILKNLIKKTSASLLKKQKGTMR